MIHVEQSITAALKGAAVYLIHVYDLIPLSLIQWSANDGKHLF
jgi:hypothetical protein